MSDAIKHECGIALLQLKKPLSFYKEKYGSTFYGINKMYLLMEKQHNRVKMVLDLRVLNSICHQGKDISVVFGLQTNSLFKRF